MKKQLITLITFTSISLQAGFLGNAVDNTVGAARDLTTDAVHTPGRILNGQNTQGYNRQRSFSQDRYNHHQGIYDDGYRY